MIKQADYQPRTLAELAVSAGTSLQIESVSNGKRFKSEWVGSSEGRFIYIRSALGAQKLMPGTQLRIRLLHDNWACAFTTQVDSHIHSPESLWVLSHPENIELARLRSDTRLPIAIRVRVDGADPLAGPEGASALISDIHMSGAALESHTPVGKLGDQIFLTTRLNFADTEHLVMLTANIVNHSDAPSESIYTEHYGLAFAPMDDETRVYLRGFLAETRLASMGYAVD